MIQPGQTTLAAAQMGMTSQIGHEQRNGPQRFVHWLRLRAQSEVYSSLTSKVVPLNPLKGHIQAGKR